MKGKNMDFIEYQEELKNYSNYPQEIAPIALALSLQSEVGQLSNKLNTFLLSPDDRDISSLEINKIIISLGDILKNITELATVFNTDMNQVAAFNLRKLSLLKEKELQEKNAHQDT